MQLQTAVSGLGPGVFSAAAQAAMTKAQGLETGRKGLSTSLFKGLLVAVVLVLLLFQFIANIMPDLHDDINSTAFRDIPGGTLVADNVTLFILLIVLAVVVVGFIKLID